MISVNIGILFFSFISGNLDFFLILVFLLKKHKLKDVVIGYLIGIILILILSYAIGSSLRKILPEWILGILGIIPIYLAFHDNDEENGNLKYSGIKDVIITYFSTCLGCNLSVFLPIIISENNVAFFYTLVFIGILTVIITFLIKLIMRNQKIINLIDKYGEIAMKVCYVAIGLYVFYDSGLISHIISIC